MLYQTVLCLLTSSLFKNTVSLFPWVFFRNRSQTTLKCGREAKKKKKNDTWDVSRVCHWCSYHILKSAGNLNSYFTGHKRLVLYSFWPLQVNGHHGTSCFVPCIFKRPATFLFRLSTLRLRYNWIASFTQFFFFGPGWFFLFFCRRAESIIVSIRPAYDISVRPFVPLRILERDCWQQRKRRNKFKNKYNAGADPGEVKWVNFRPLFSEPPSFFFFFLSLKYWNNIWFLWFLWLRWREFTPHFKILDPRL